MSKQVFLKSSESFDIIISFIYRQMRNEKREAPPTSPFFTDENEKLSINEVLEVLIGVGTFTSTSSVDTQSLQFATMNKLKKPVPGGS